MEPNSPHGDTQSIQPASDPREIARQNLQRPNEVIAKPESIGRYKILDTLGEGGMGIVYLAEQNKPIHRRVALKIIKLGMDTKQVMARFETEREALALMNHPNVARVFDAGATETGRPYFAMEYVAGIPITEYCDKHRLTTEERLRLFMDVCHAVQHAHQKGIIHRDIKPSNVLVSLEGGNPPMSPHGKGGAQSPSCLRASVPSCLPVIKVIDFGVAKATQHRLTERTLFTEQGQLIGTPGYMSPEQAEMTALDIDTRTDIYSLGVLLYELLVGAMPFDTKTLLQAGVAEIQRIIREVDPPKPSTRLSALASAIPLPEPSPSGGGHPRDESRGSSIDDIARRRHTEPKTLIRQIRGDLDWIVMRAMEKDRTRRYDTANAIAVEIQRYLNHEPVLAGPPSAGYRLRKFVRRNRGPVGAGVVVAIVLVGGLVGTSYGLAQAVRAREAEAEQRLIAEEREREAVAAREAEAGQRRIAEEREKDATEARDRAKDEAAKATRIQQFLQEMLASANPERAKGADFTVREVLDEAAQRIGSELKDQPGVEAAVRHTIGLAYAYLGRHKEAKEHFEIAVRLRRDPDVADELDLADSLRELAGLVRIVDKDIARSRAMYSEALAIRERRLGKDHPLTVELLTDLAETERVAADEPASLGLAAEAIRRITGKTSSDEELTAEWERSLDELSGLWREGRREEALNLLRSEMRPYVDSGLPMQTVVGIFVSLSDRRQRAGDYDAVEPLLREGLRIAREANEPMYIAQALQSLGALHRRKRDYAEATECFSEALELERRIYGDEHEQTLSSIEKMGLLLLSQGKLPEAEAYFREGLERSRRVLGEEHPRTFPYMNNLAVSLSRQARHAEAEVLYRKILDIAQGTQPAQDSVIRQALLGLASTLVEQEKYEEAEAYYRKAIEEARRVEGQDSHFALHGILELGSLLHGRGKSQDAEGYFRQVLQSSGRVRDGEGKGCPLIHSASVLLGDSLVRQERFAEAEPFLREGLQIRQTTLPEEHSWLIFNAMSILGECLTGLKKHQEAETLLLEASEGLYENREAIPVRIRAKRLGEAVERIVKLYESWDAVEPGKGYAEKAAEWRAKLAELNAETQKRRNANGTE